MRPIFLCGLIAAACGAAGTAVADGYDDTGAVYISPMANYTLLDSKRVSNDNFNYQIAFGYNLPANLAAEFTTKSQ